MILCGLSKSEMYAPSWFSGIESEHLLLAMRFCGLVTTLQHSCGWQHEFTQRSGSFDCLKRCQCSITYCCWVAETCALAFEMWNSWTGVFEKIDAGQSMFNGASVKDKQCRVLGAHKVQTIYIEAALAAQVQSVYRQLPGIASQGVY